MCSALAHAGVRANAYTDDANMKSKIKFIAQEHKTPYILVVGQKEKDENSVSVRFRSDSGMEQKSFSLEQFIAYVREKTDSHYNGI